MSDFSAIRDLVAPLLAGVPEGDPSGAELRRFLDYRSSKGVDPNHPFLRGLDPANANSYARYLRLLTPAVGARDAETILIEYLQNYERRTPLDWESFSQYARIVAALKKVAGAERLEKAAGLMERNLLAPFVQKHLESCPYGAEACGGWYEDYAKLGYLVKDPSLLEKVLSRLSGNGLGYVAGRTFDRLREKLVTGLWGSGAEGIDETVRSGDIALKKERGGLPGFAIGRVKVGGRDLGTLVIGDPSLGARAGLRVRNGGAIAERELTGDARLKGCLQYQGTLSMQRDDGRILGPVAVNGEMDLQNFDANRQHGLVLVFPDGKLAIIDRRRFPLSTVTGRDADRAKFVSLGHDVLAIEAFQTALRERGVSLLAGASYHRSPADGFQRWNETNGDSSIRLVFAFADGKFGVFNSNTASTNEMLAVLYRLEELGLGRVEIAVRCDRGAWDSAALYRNGKNPEAWGNSGEPSNRLYFYSAPACPKGEK